MNGSEIARQIDEEYRIRKYFENIKKLENKENENSENKEKKKKKKIC